MCLQFTMKSKQFPVISDCVIYATYNYKFDFSYRKI